MLDLTHKYVGVYAHTDEKGLAESHQREKGKVVATRGKTLKDFGISLEADGTFVAAEAAVSRNLTHWKAVEGSPRNSAASATSVTVAGQVTPKASAGVAGGFGGGDQ